MSSDNYYHFTFEVLTRLVLLLDHLSHEGLPAPGTRLVLPPGPERQSRRVVEEALEVLASRNPQYEEVLEELVLHFYESRKEESSFQVREKEWDPGVWGVGEGCYIKGRVTRSAVWKHIARRL